MGEPLLGCRRVRIGAPGVGVDRALGEQDLCRRAEPLDVTGDLGEPSCVASVVSCGVEPTHDIAQLISDPFQREHASTIARGYDS
jgi:hypothetical protein